MQIKVEKFGAIQKGTVDLSKKITIFCGPNGTGKTYMSYLIYGLLGSRKNILDPEENLFHIEDLMAHKEIKIPINKRILSRYRDETLRAARRNFDIIFGISEENVRNIFLDTKFRYGVSNNDFYQFILSSEFQIEFELFGALMSLKKQLDSSDVTVKMLNSEPHGYMYPRIGVFLLSAIYYQLSIYPINRAYIFPVERNSVFTFSKELSIRKQEKWDQVQRIFEKKEKEGIDQIEIMMASSKRYPMPIRDNLMVADDIGEIKKKRGEFYDFAETIEKNLLHGVMSVSGEDDLIFQPRVVRKGYTLPIQITASIVKSMSGLIVYLKHIARKNDLIIIDEPEINLHPEGQLILTRIFAEMANAGFRLLISTHSDYVIRELNNLIMGAQNPSVAKKLGYSENELISKDEVSVHYFKLDPKIQKSTICNVEVRRSGFEAPSIDATIRKQTDVAETLFYKLK